jgi:putative flippase GtrA
LRLGTASWNTRKVLAPVMDTAVVVPASRDCAALPWDTRKRLVAFAASGMLVFILGVVVQWALIRCLGMGNVSSYVVKSVLSVQLTFLLSRYLTWGDRNLALLPALVRWNIQQLVITSLGVCLYTGLGHFGMNSLAGNIAVAVIFTPTSFVVGHLWSMAGQAASLRLIEKKSLRLIEKKLSDGSWASAGATTE